MKNTTQQMKKMGYTCKQVSGCYGQHYAVYLGETRISYGISTHQTARGAWDEAATKVGLK